MSLPNNTISALLIAKAQMRKWRLFAIFLIVVSLILLSYKKERPIDKTGSVLQLAENYIGKIEIDGILLKDTYRSEVLKQIKEDKRIKALIVNIDSPGGEVVESEMLYDSLREIAMVKPIVVILNGSGASGGYMVALASDYIIAKNGTLTGSIGVLLQSFEATELAKKVGINFMTYKSSKLKGSPSPFEKENAEVNKVIQESVDDIYHFFVELVANRRGMKIARAYEVSNGQVYTGRQALKLGLIDAIGGEQEALAYLETKGIDTKKLDTQKIDLKKPISEFNIVDRFLGMFFKSQENAMLKKYSLLLL